MQTQITIPYDQIADFCHRHHIRTLALFGSVLREDFRPDSDVDVLVEFEQGARISYFDMVDIQDGLAAIFGHAVDVGTPDMLSPFIARQVMASTRTIYGE